MGGTVIKVQNPNKNYYLLTYGCQMNVRDSETIAGLLEAAGYSESAGIKEADLIVLNTCGVRHSAENKVFGKLGELKNLKRSKPHLMIAVGGCMAQIPEARRMLQKIGVDVVFGTHNIHELPLLIEEAMTGQKAVSRVYDIEGEARENLPAVRKPGLSAYVNIMFGCNNYCSYCIVPFTRGRERSRRPEAVIREVKELRDQGFKEVTLLGQNVNSYGRGLDEQVDFSDLLAAVNDVQGIERIRFTTSHPKDMSDKLIKAIADLDKVCEHVHLPLQAGSNTVLQNMNRGYTRDHYLQLIRRIRKHIPGAAISTDLIVGFPGESEEDFLDTLDMVEKVRFDAAFTFMYSPRSGTKAALMKENLAVDEKKKRLLRLNYVQYKIATEINQKLEGKIEEVLVEGPSKTNPEKLTGRTRTNRIVIFSGPNSIIGEVKNVKITEARTFSMFGELT